MTYVVTDNCIGCKYTDCVEVCPVDCFYEGENTLVIHPDECIDCGVCEPECPADAIRPDTEPDMEKWVEFNRKYSELWPQGPSARGGRAGRRIRQAREILLGKTGRGRLSPNPCRAPRVARIHVAARPPWCRAATWCFRFGAIRVIHPICMMKTACPDVAAAATRYDT